MKKILFSAMLAVLLAFGLVVTACDNGTTSSVSIIPGELQGIYQVAGYTMKINANGKGTIDGADCTFLAVSNTLTAKMGNDVTNVGYDVTAEGKIEFTAPTINLTYLSYVFTAIAAEPAVKPDQSSITPNVIPDALIGEWEYSSQTIFIINGNGTGKVYNTGTLGYDDAKWSVPSVGKLKLQVYIGTDYESDTTFDYIATTDELSIPTATAGSGLVAGAISGYTAFSPMTKTSGGPTGPKIEDYKFYSDTTSIAGDWKTLPSYVNIFTTIPLPSELIFQVNANGTGQVYFGGALVDCTYAITADKTKIKVTLLGNGAFVGGYTVTSGQLSITGVTGATDILASDGAAGTLIYYYMYNPLEKDE